MRKLLAVFAAIILLLPLAGAARGETGEYRVVIEDAAELLSPAEEVDITEKIRGITRYCNAGVYTYAGPDISEAYILGEEWGEKQFGKENYLLFMIHLTGRMITFVSSPAVFAAVPFERGNAVMDDVIPYLVDGDYAESVRKAMEGYEPLLAEYDPVIREYREFIRETNQVRMPGFDFLIPAGFRTEWADDNTLRFYSPDGSVMGGIENSSALDGIVTEEQFNELMIKMEAEENIGHIHKMEMFHFWGPSGDGMKIFAMVLWHNGCVNTVYAIGKEGTEDELVKTVKMIGYGAYPSE